LAGNKKPAGTAKRVREITFSALAVFIKRPQAEYQIGAGVIIA
jgi:hypothetical protein